MTTIHLYTTALSLSEPRLSIEGILTTRISARRAVLASLARKGLSVRGSMFQAGYFSRGRLSADRPTPPPTYDMPSHENKPHPTQPERPNRYSVVYLLNERHMHLGRPTREEAELALKALFDDKDRTPVGIYDEKTELFDWDHSLREEYEKASMWEQGRRGEEIISITQALRRRDLSWESGEFRRPGFFA